MIYKFVYDGKYPPIYVIAESLDEAQEKFNNHKFEFQLNEKDFIAINMISGHSELRDAHKSDNPKLFGYRYAQGCIRSPVDIEGVCIADNYQQVITKLSPLQFDGVWRYENGDEIVIT